MRTFRPCVFMKAFICFILTVSSLVSLPLLQSVSAVSKEKEYEDTIVILVDVSSGMLGVEIEEEETHAKQKLSFIVNSAKVYVTNQINQNLEFSDIRPGDKVDLVVTTGDDGKEEVTDIIDFNQVKKD